MASPNGATISRDQAVPYIVNFQMVDGDGNITADEFKAVRQGYREKHKVVSESNLGAPSTVTWEDNCVAI